MIKIEISNTTPMTGLTHGAYGVPNGVELSGGKSCVLGEVITSQGVCQCSCTCQYSELAFWSNLAGSRYNDKSTFVYKGGLNSDTFVAKIFKDGIFVGNVNSTLCSEYYDYGTYSLRDDWFWFTIDWAKVKTIHGDNSNYCILVEKTSYLGNEEYRSQTFFLAEYTEQKARGTVKIEAIQNGIIMRDGLNFIGTNTYFSLRIAGNFGSKKPTFITDNILLSNRTKIQVQDSVENEYTLQTRLLPSYILNQLWYNYFLANEITINNYYGYENYTNLKVYPITYEPPNYYLPETKAVAEFKFSDKVQNIIKRNYI